MNTATAATMTASNRSKHFFFIPLDCLSTWTAKCLSALSSQYRAYLMLTPTSEIFSRWAMTRN